MPFYHFYEEDPDELDAENEDLDSAEPQRTDSSRFTYEDAQKTFDRSTFDATTRLVLETLLRMGATHFYVRYDGGSDEGFAYPESLWFNSTERSAKEVAEEMAKSSDIERIRDAAMADRYNPYLNHTAEEKAQIALDSLADALASSLLGEGFGTGEYELYGAFTANLATGDIVDDPEARRPDSRY